MLPFDNLSSDPEQGYFADGIAEDIITELSRFKSLAVMARNASFAYRGHTQPIRQVIEELDVTYVLEGSVRRAGRRLRITAQLIDGLEETHVWADRFDVDVDSMFEVQDEITRAVAGALAVNIEEAHLDQVRRQRPEDLEAYDLWLRGMECMRRGTASADEEARRLFQSALDVDPHYARAHAGISLTHFNNWSCQAWDRWDERERGAFEAARRAVDLDDNDHVTHGILGRIYGYRQEFALADKHFERALTLNPNDPECLLQISFGKMLLGQHETAYELVETAFRRSPKHGDWYHAFAAYPLFMLERYDETVQNGERAPDVAVDVPAFLAAACGRLGRMDDAKRWADRYLADFQEKITFGRQPEPGEPVRWLFHVNPWQHEADRTRVREGLALAGLE